MGKKAITTVELVNESVEISNSAIVDEMLEWFRDEAVPVRWVKEIKKVVVQKF